MGVSLLDHRGHVMKTVHTDAHDPDRVVEVTHEDLDPLIGLADALRHAKTQGPDMKLVGFIPVHVAERMMREGSWNDPAALARWLNDPQNECFRVWKGKVKG